MLTCILLVACQATPAPRRAVAAPPVATSAPAPRPQPAPILAPGPVVVQRDTALHLDATDGPEIGRAFAGAKVEVLRVEGQTAEVKLAAWDRPFRVEGGVSVRPLTAWTDAAALGERPVPLVEPAPLGHPARDHYQRIGAAPGTWGFAYTRCGPLQVLEQGDRTTRVSQRDGGVELVGWTESAVRTARGDHRCPPRIVEKPMMRSADAPEPAVPEGFARAGAVDTGEVLRPGRTIYWLVEGEDGFTCQDWRVTRGLLRRRFTDGGERFHVEYSLERDGDRVTLLGPSGGSSRGAEWSMGCGQVYAAVDATADRLVLVPGVHSLTSVLAYHPDDTEVWYLTRRACETARTAAASPDASAPSTASGWAPVHAGC